MQHDLHSDTYPCPNIRSIYHILKYRLRQREQMMDNNGAGEGKRRQAKASEGGHERNRGHVRSSADSFQVTCWQLTCVVNYALQERCRCLRVAFCAAQRNAHEIGLVEEDKFLRGGRHLPPHLHSSFINPLLFPFAMSTRPQVHTLPLHLITPPFPLLPLPQPCR